MEELGVLILFPCDQVMGCPEDEARWFFQQFIIGLDYCHRMGIANRDIKLDNILLHGRDSRPVVKICDFGYSKDEVAGSICKTACGTPEYMAPEVRELPAPVLSP